ncbi:MAG: Alkaline phosphatase synthesis sensor protein PhoR [Chloroflexi bacterium]|nr:Alkaline phosphatase synthesis sensor protein PhoR [Chloroflexota bacterium]
MVAKVEVLETGQKLNAMQEDFVATVFHNLRTPLGFIKGYTTTLLRENTEWDEETVREFLEIIDDEADELQILIDNLLDSSRLQSGTLRMRFQDIRLDILLRDIAKRAVIIDFGMPVSVSISDDSMIVNADAARLTQVFENLFSNINKYAPDSSVTLTLTREDDQAHIVLEDTGPGLRMGDLEKIFNRFYRVPETMFGVRGSGLGLYICRQIIDAHHGEIFAESTLGEGTAFHIYLPVIN